MLKRIIFLWQGIFKQAAQLNGFVIDKCLECSQKDFRVKRQLPEWHRGHSFKMAKYWKIFQVFFYRRLSTVPKGFFFWKWCKLFKFFLKRRLTRFWWITEKYCKSEKFQIGHKSIMPHWKLFGLAIFFFRQKRVRRLLKKRLNSLHYITWLFFELFQQTLVADF